MASRADVVRAGGDVRSYLAAVNRARIAYRAGSPGQLRRLGAMGVLGALLVGAGGALAVTITMTALNRADDALTHRDRLQSARVELFRADADAAGAFLRGGLEPTDQRRQFLASLSSASGNVIAAAGSGAGGAGSHDGRYIQVNRALTEYSGLLETARSSNRQALPVGASYLQIGSDLLNRSVLPPLGAMAQEDSDRADAAFTLALWSAVAFVVCVVAGGVLLARSQYQLAQVTHSVFTGPAAVTGALLAVVALAVAVLVLISAREAVEVRDGDVRRVADLVEARAGAFEARAAENLTLVARGARPQGENEWQQAQQRVVAASEDAVTDWPGLDSSGDGVARLFPSFPEYLEKHAELHRADLDGDWPGAVRLATDTGDGGLTAAFSTFDQDSAERLTGVSRSAERGLDDAGGGLGRSALAVLLAGLIAAAGTAFGVARRLGEYR